MTACKVSLGTRKFAAQPASAALTLQVSAHANAARVKAAPTLAPAIKAKHGAAFKLAGDADFAAVGFDNRARDGQTHARSLHPVALVLATIELIENQPLLHVVNAETLVGDTDFEVGALQLGGDADRGLGRRILGGILQQLDQDFLGAVGVQAGR